MAKPFLMPTTYFSLPLGLGATAIAWLHSHAIFPWGSVVGNDLGIAAVATWLLFIGLFIYKIIAYREQVMEELNCPVRFSTLALIPITTMISGDLLHVWQMPFATYLILFGVIAQVLYASYKIAGLWLNHSFSENDVQPLFYLPSVASNFTSASSLALLGYHDLAYLFFGAGLLSWLMFEPVLLQRLRLSPLPEMTKMTIGIVLAPAFVGVNAYLAINGGEIDLLAKILWGYGFLQLLFLARIFPTLLDKGFSISLWAFSFGLASMASSAVHFYQQPSFKLLAMIAFIFASLMIMGLIIGTLLKVVQGKFWVK